jgi:aspartate kinase
MKVFKFGGGILHSADEIKKMPGILRMFPKESLLIVVSAFGKTTNALEKLTDSAIYNKGDRNAILQEIFDYHDDIIHHLFKEDADTVKKEFHDFASSLAHAIAENAAVDYAEFYDRVIGYGELISSTIVHHYLKEAGVENHWFDVRKILKTDSTFRDATVNWELSRANAENIIRPYFENVEETLPVLVTQGFIGSDIQGRPVSLGREGSDYTASIFANLLDASEVIIWKDVPGVLNADPKHFRQTIKLDEISYAEATELAYYGAKVIHPKTVKPLQNKQIPLQVRSYLDPYEPGTLIHANATSDKLIPSFIFKFDQVLISVSKKDLSFVNEQTFSDVFSLLSKFYIHMNILQNSALTLTLCIDNNNKINELIKELQTNYNVRYNDGLELVTIRHYNERASSHVLQGKVVLLEQQNRTVVQYVVR